MKKIFLSLVYILTVMVADAQDIPCSIQKSNVFKDEYKYSTIVSVDEDDNGGVVIARSYRGGVLSSASGYYFEHYDANMNLMKDYEYELKNGWVMGVVVSNNKVHIIEFTYESDEKAYLCSASTANLDNFKFVTKELFRLERDEVKSGGIGSLFSVGDFDNDSWADMLVNNDKTAFAVTIDIDDKEKRNEMHKIYVYDTNLNLKIEHVFKRELKDRKFIYENLDVSADGNVAYVLGRARTDEAKKKKKGGRYQYELTRITNTDSKTQVFDTDEHYARSLRTVMKKDKIACVGFYSDRKDSRFKGLCYFDMDPLTLDIKTTKFNPFTTQFMIDKYGKEKDKELKNISFRKVFLTDNNEIVFNAEEYYVTVQHTQGANGTMGNTYYVYHYDDIVSAKLGADGDLVWARNINKRQATMGSSAFISYTSMVKDNDTYFFINTGEKVRKLKNDRIQFTQKKAKKSNLNIIRINQNGDFEYKEILDDKDNEVPFMVSDGAIAKQGGTIYFIGQKGRKKQLLKIKI